MTLDMKAVDRWVQEALEDERYEKDEKLAARMFMELARAVEPELTPAQLKGLEVAERFWQGRATEAERLEQFKVLGDQQRKIDTSGRALSAESARNRLVWASLNTIEGLSSFMGDFLVGEAQQAGIPMDVVDSVFARIVPSYRRKQVVGSPTDGPPPRKMALALSDIAITPASKDVARRVQEALCDERHEKDVKLAAAMFIDLARTVEAQLTPAQLEGVNVAERFWQGRATEAERLNSFEVLEEQQSAIDGSGRVLSAEWARNRLAWASLITREGLSCFMGGFLISLAERAGIPMDVVDDIFARHVPSYRTAK